MANGHVTLEQAERVAHLARSGELSLRRIAQDTGVSLGTVAAIARGDRDTRATPTAEPLGEYPPDCGGNECGRCVSCVAREAQRDRHSEAAQA